MTPWIRNLHRVRCLVAAGLALALLGWSSPATALTFEVTYESSLSGRSNFNEIKTKIEEVIAAYEAGISSVVTVKILFAAPHACTSQNTPAGCMHPNDLGESKARDVYVPYAKIRQALLKQATSANDHLANHHAALNPLRHCPKDDFACSGHSPIDGGEKMRLHSANARALGLSGAPGWEAVSFFKQVYANKDLDGVIRLNVDKLNLCRDTSPTGLHCYDSSKYDIVQDISHELNEVLGLGSGLDAPESDGSEVCDENGSNCEPEFPKSSGLQDLYRYSAKNTRNYTTSTSAESYFSLDGGKTSLVKFNQRINNSVGDWGDWYSCGNPLESTYTPRVQDACASRGEHGFLDPGGLAWTALDVQGWTLISAHLHEGHRSQPVADRTTPSGRATAAKTRAVRQDGQCRLRAASRALRRGHAVSDESQCTKKLTAKFKRVHQRHGAHPGYGPVDWHAARSSEQVQAHLETTGATLEGTNLECAAALVKAFASHIRCESRAAWKESKGRDPRRARARCDAQIERRVNHLDLKHAGEASCTAGIEASELIAASRDQ